MTKVTSNSRLMYDQSHQLLGIGRTASRREAVGAASRREVLQYCSVKENRRLG
jgi:hypothetical protein